MVSVTGTGVGESSSGYVNNGGVPVCENVRSCKGVCECVSLEWEMSEHIGEVVYVSVCTWEKMCVHVCT